MPVRHASGAAADRLVVIGDAAVSRYYKNGIGSAYVTATLAARAADNSQFDGKAAVRIGRSSV